jgi:protein phosphatase
MKLVSVAKTDVGRKRKLNEDSFLVDEALGLFVVADGMGGHAAGEVASKEAVETLRDAMLGQAAVIEAARADPNPENTEAVRKLVEFAVQSAAYQVFAMTEVDPSRKGMGTTVSMLLVQPVAAFIAHVGDSRIYVMRKGIAKVATTDHTFVNALVQQGRMTAEQAQKSRYSNVLLRAVGSKDYVEVDTRMIRHAPGDVFMLCSDGLHGYLKTEELPQLIDPNDLTVSADRLVQAANDRGGKDNITTVLVRVDP